MKMPVSEAMEQPVMPNSSAEADWQAAQFAHLSAFSFGTTAFSISLLSRSGNWIARSQLFLLSSKAA